MAAATPLMRSVAVAVWLAAIRSVVVAMDDFLSKSDLRRALKFSRGRLRKFWAMRSSGAKSGLGWRTSACRSTLSSSSLNASAREGLGIGTLHLRPQAFQSAELKLLDRSFASSKLLRNLTNASLLHEALEDHAPLVGGKPVYESKQPRLVLYLLQ